MTIFTFNHYSSDNKGGVEFLIKQIRNVSKNINYEFKEIYLDHSINSSNDNICIKSERSIISKFFELFSSHAFFNVYDFSDKDVLIVFSPKYLNLIPIWVLKKVRVILVQTNKLEVYTRKKNKLGLFFKLKFVNDVVLYSKHDKNVLHKYLNLAEDQKIHVIPRGTRIKTSQNPPIYTNKIITIARINEKQKNFTAMIDIMKMLPQYSLDIFGVGSDGEIKELKRKLSGVKNVKFKGEATDIESILNRYSLFIMTSHFEGFGQTLIEARSQGLPLVAFDTFEALPTIIKSGFNGEIVQYNDYMDFKEAINSILRDESTYLRYATNALQSSVGTAYDTVSEKWINCLTDVKNA